MAAPCSSPFALIKLDRLHQACTRAARADYCGDGRAFTRDRSLIDMFDGHDFNVQTGESGFAPEATFASDGASQVTRLRWPTERAKKLVWRCLAERKEAGASHASTVVHVHSRP